VTPWFDDIQSDMEHPSGLTTAAGRLHSCISDRIPSPLDEIEA